MICRRRQDPQPPTGVRLAYHDGATTGALPAVYVGRERVDGVRMNVWEVVPPDGRIPSRVVIDYLPERTMVVFHVDP